MAKESGSVNNNPEPCVFVDFENGEKVEFLIDTGFNGSLCLPRLPATELGLKKVSEVEVYGVGAHSENLDVALVKIVWFGKEIEVEVLINDGDDWLLGSELLNKKTLKINYRSKMVVISDK